MITLVERLMARVEKTESCWLWTGSVDPCGYGRIVSNRRIDSTHRVAYAAFKGEIPNGMCVCHACDTPRCVNPDHLWLGSQAENMRDMLRKGRSTITHRRGESNRNAKLTEKDVREIRRLYGNGGVTTTEIGRLFGVYSATVSKIVRRERWGHVDDPLDAAEGAKT